MKKDAAAYLKVAADLRAAIQSGEYGPNAKLPSETELTKRYNCSRIVAKKAIDELKTDGLVYGKQGSGIFVAVVKPLLRRTPIRELPVGTTSPFARDTEASGREPRWDHESREVPASPDVARRLGIAPGEPVIETRYVFYDDGEPVMLSVSWEPAALTAGTPVHWPEDGPIVGVIARMASIGQRPDEVVEQVRRRPATRDERRLLQLPSRGAQVWDVVRTYLREGKPVETADIQLHPRWVFEYRIPLN